MMLLATIAVVLIWDANTEPDLAGYNIYYGVKSATYTNKLSAWLSTTNEVRGLAPGATFYFAVTALNTNGAESDFSNEISWTEPEPPPPRLVERKCEGVDTRSLTFSWGTVPGAIYRVSATDDLSAQWYGWIDLTGDMVATGETMEWSVPFAEPQRFYRVVQMQQ